ncbi:MULTISPECIES: methyltransferase domain-containing protein [unclassified Saccharopolyspora]|uniref:class I SAM-dependent methyltransferase n=1 Tax=unclassified Saccharopolyspora TaxID=2646250 RepID=UPI001CD56F69|nr:MULTISPECIES: methyltransferase domain-containing protein [unclassified Saccharopolyspora]MCA1186256.1 methyltransferase domain-containing protein [Saccharopolyspora sp. 6T]MCA1192225.1 methyltransferase domain-containing protein [Saccharopolyspora sp. 6V]MCA1227570.1 methyltransferase domain-containing protein [Saccharopolyspora sp. 6M]MCA1281699.1 methyltransferase domain-containing protein [Saccharopolyspora sp. 7B]
MTTSRQRPQTGRPASVFADYRKFAARAARKPGLVGAVAPSSPHLAREMASIVPRTASETGPVVVELGPGTGALSRAVRDRLPEGGRHLAIELDSGMVEHLRADLPWLEVVQGDAAKLRTLLVDHGVDRVDAVISGLPWSIFPGELQRDILAEVGQVLVPGGAFTTFAYVHALGMSGARAFRNRLDLAFDEVLTSRTVWRNVPPARIYTCRRPIS